MAETESVKVSPRDPVLAVIQPALKVGAACGTTGFLLGGAAGIIKGTTPFLFATASGIQTFALGTTFWGCRSVVLEVWAPERRSDGDLIKVSAISGGITGGTIGLLVRGRSNVLPGALMFSLFGLLGQTAYNSFSRRREEVQEPKEGFWRRMSEKSWSPVKVMDDEEYVELLKEKMLKVDVEIAILDDKIAALRQQQQSEEQPSETTTPREK